MNKRPIGTMMMYLLAAGQRLDPRKMNRFKLRKSPKHGSRYTNAHQGAAECARRLKAYPSLNLAKRGH